MATTGVQKPGWGKVALGSFSTPEQMAFVRQVYAWMCAGLVITAAVAYFVAAVTPTLARAIIDSEPLFIGLIIVEFILVILISAMVQSLSVTACALIFLAYAALNGLTMSVVFLVFTINSIGSVFVLTAGLFGVMSLYGYLTNRDLTTAGNFALMTLLGLIVALVANLFLRSSVTDFVLACVGVLVFVVLTAYDTQKLRWMYEQGRTEGADGERKEAINAALTLYLDFVNLFLDLLRLFGKRR